MHDYSAGTQVIVGSKTVGRFDQVLFSAMLILFSSKVRSCGINADLCAFGVQVDGPERRSRADETIAVRQTCQRKQFAATSGVKIFADQIPVRIKDLGHQSPAEDVQVFRPCRTEKPIGYAGFDVSEYHRVLRAIPPPGVTSEAHHAVVAETHRASRPVSTHVENGFRQVRNAMPFGLVEVF